MNERNQAIDAEYDNIKELMNNTPSGVLVVDARHYAMSVPKEIQEMVIDCDEGIYFNGATKPLLLMQFGPYGTALDYRDHGMITKPLTLDEILCSRMDIVNRAGVTVISASTLVHRRTSLHTKPKCSKAMINAVIAIVLDRLYSINAVVNNNKGYRYKLPLYLKIEECERDKIDKFTDSFQPVLDELLKFIGNDIWHMYFHKEMNNLLLIEKTVDFRIYDWHRIHETMNNND
jgi:hypothetical protein